MPADDISISASGTTPEHWDSFFMNYPNTVFYAESTDNQHIINLTYNETDKFKHGTAESLSESVNS